MSQIIIGYTTEGTTDSRFLSSVIYRTFVNVGFECRKEIEVVEPLIYIEKGNENNFVEKIHGCCRMSSEKGVMVFCIHVDSDSNNDENVFTTRMRPLSERINAEEREICKNIVPVVPVQMIESWMLADKQLLKEEIGTMMSDAELGINKHPEWVTDPKKIIEDAIRIAREGMVRRRRRDLTISELYQPLGQKIAIENLDKLPSYMKFKDAVRVAYRALNYLQ